MMDHRSPRVRALGCTVLAVATLVVVTRAEAQNPTSRAGVAQSAQANSDKDVNVVNTPTVIVGNTPTVDARQNGTWTVSVSGTPGVTIENGPGHPIPVVGQLRSSPTEPFHQTLSAQFVPGDVFGNVFFSVPLGKRLVVEHVSLEALVPVGQLVRIDVVRLSDFARHFLVTTPMGSFGGGLDTHTVSQPIRMYADGAAQAIVVEVQRNNTNGGGGVISSMSGFLVDVP